MTNNQAQHLLDLINNEINGTDDQRKLAEFEGNNELFKSLDCHLKRLKELRQSFLNILKGVKLK